MTESKGTILIVEDNNDVRDVAVEMFSSAGFAVIEADNAETGLEKFEAHPEIVLVFTDLILPGGITGIELSKNILEIKPDALILFATGYQDKGEAIEESTFGLANIAYVPKPYDVDEIPRVVEAMLEKAGVS